MISSNLLLENNTNTITELESININESFLFTSLDFLKEINEEINLSNKILYKCISESEEEYSVVTESFSDFKEAIKKIIDKFIDFIKSICKRFFIHLNKIISSDKYLLKNLHLLDDFRMDIILYRSMYKFTLYPGIPLPIVSSEYNDDIETEYLKQKVAQMIDNRTSDQTTTDSVDYTLDILKTLYKNTVATYNEDRWEEFRGKVLDQDKRISKEDYADELFRIYRNGDSVKEAIKVDSSIINDSLYFFKNYKDIFKQVENLRNKIEDDYRNIKKSLEKNTNDIFKDIDQIKIKTQEQKIAADMFFKAKANQVETMCSIHTLAFTAKLDAIKDKYIQDKDILYRCLNMAVKERSERGVL